MVDYSFIRLKPTFLEAKDIGDSPVTTHPYYDYIQLLPNETYLQITNIENSISFQGDYQVFVIDCNDNSIADVTDNIFIEEFTDSNGLNQLKIEYVNLGVDFYRQTVYFKFVHTISDVVYYSNPINITSYESEQTSFFEYWSYNDFQGLGYTNADCKQSIRVKTYFDIPINESEVQDYHQISTQNTISARMLIKKKERYQLDYINAFTYDRLNTLFAHDIVYLSGVRVTNKPIVESSDREGQSNFMVTGFDVYKNYNDKKDYEYQIFEGLTIDSENTPTGSYTSAILPDVISMTFNIDVILGIGTIKIYGTSGLVHTFTESDLTVISNVLSGTGLQTYITANDDYYVKVSSGIVSSLGVEFEGIDDETTWTFRLTDGQFNKLQFNNSQFITD